MESAAQHCHDAKAWRVSASGRVIGAVAYMLVRGRTCPGCLGFSADRTRDAAVHAGPCQPTKQKHGCGQPQHQEQYKSHQVAAITS
jgi:hypothetical protein